MKRNVSMASAGFLGLALVLPALVAGCGGGGGKGGGGTGGVDVSTLSNVRVDAILSGSGREVDPTTIFPGESVKFRLTGINDSGNRVFVNATGFRTTAPSNVGRITSDGTFSALAAGSPFSVSTTIRGVTYSTVAQVKTPQAIVTGLIRTTNGVGAGRILVRAIDGNGNEVATGYSATDGTLRLSVPTSAIRFALDFSAVDPSGTVYVRQYAYNGVDYSSSIPGCNASLPPLTNGSTTGLASDIVVYLLSNSTPPPPPDGCTGS